VEQPARRTVESAIAPVRRMMRVMALFPSLPSFPRQAVSARACIAD